MLKMGSSGNCVKNGLEGTIADAQKLVKKQSSRLECGQLVLRWPRQKLLSVPKSSSFGGCAEYKDSKMQIAEWLGESSSLSNISEAHGVDVTFS